MCLSRGPLTGLCNGPGEAGSRTLPSPVLLRLVGFTAPTRTPQGLLTVNDRAEGWGSTLWCHDLNNAGAFYALPLALAPGLDNETAKTSGDMPPLFTRGVVD